MSDRLFCYGPRMLGFFRKKQKGTPPRPNTEEASPAIGDPMHASSTPDADDRTWIFVSHASADIGVVRTVRNHLEDKGASPLLFHLKALTNPEEFWPIIEREIQARNFFLYCESDAAERSEWVQRERQAVEVAQRRKPKRIGRIRVDRPEIDLATLDEFVSKTRVYPSYARADRIAIAPFLSALVTVGFRVFDDTNLPAGESFPNTIASEIDQAAKDGWVVVFLSAHSIQRPWVQREVQLAANKSAKIVPVMLEKVSLPPQLAFHLGAVQWFDATVDPTTAPTRLANELLGRK